MRMIKLVVVAAFLGGCGDGSQREHASTSQAGASATALNRPDSPRMNAPRVVQTGSGPIATLPEVMAAAMRRTNASGRAGQGAWIDDERARRGSNSARK
jgi:hypothetical protein